MNVIKIKPHCSLLELKKSLGENSDQKRNVSCSCLLPPPQSFLFDEDLKNVQVITF